MNRYRLIRRIASGGMGEVHEARMILAYGCDMPCAVKVIRKDCVDDARYQERFLREAMTALEHGHNSRHLVTALDVGVSEEHGLYLVLELVEGPNLLTMPDELRRSFPVLRRVALDVLSALRYLHAHELVHRDVNPQNILLDRHGFTKLADLGLVRRQSGSDSGELCGVPAYASRDRLEGHEATPACDLYALGAILYEWLTGKPPYGTGSAKQVHARMAEPTPELPEDTPADIRAVITGLLAPVAEERISCREARRILHENRTEIARRTTISASIEGWQKQSQPQPSEETAGTPLGIRGAILQGNARQRDESINASTAEPEPTRTERQASRWPMWLAALATAGVIGFLAGARGPWMRETQWGEPRTSEIATPMPATITAEQTAGASSTALWPALERESEVCRVTADLPDTASIGEPVQIAGTQGHPVARTPRRKPARARARGLTPATEQAQTGPVDLTAMQRPINGDFIVHVEPD